MKNSTLVLILLLVAAGIGVGVLFQRKAARIDAAEMARHNATREAMAAQMLKIERDNIAQLYQIAADSAEAQAAYAIKIGEPRTQVETLKELRLARARAERDAALAKLQ